MIKKLLNNKGSLTAEATVAFTVMLFFIIFLMTAIGMRYTETVMEEALAEASLHIRSELPLVLPTGNSIGEDLIFQTLVKKEFHKALEKREQQRFIFTANDPLEDIDVSASTYSDAETGLMKLSVQADWPIIFFEAHPCPIKRTLYCRPFSEFREPYDFLKKSGIETVYLADNPSVFHTNPDCRSIKNRNKRSVDLTSLEGRFRECKFCQRERSN